MKYLAVLLGIFGLEYGIKDYIENSFDEKTCVEKDVVSGDSVPRNTGKDQDLKKNTVKEKKPEGFLRIRRHHNRGAFLNTGQEKPKLVALLSVLLTLILTIFYLITLGQAGKGLLKWGLTLLLGGAYTNTYDRLVRKYVVDYVSFNVPFRWLSRIIFNIGDFCILIGSLLSVLGYYRA